uniref:VWFA domain-containing protein n=1 Tax=Pipistrellus kuhlii TaxID=59472 RepID=A0A7J7T1B3_PIPKU|nr:hypothetical protein mPipKuh1_009745 [Pipistrellus kuhlii]
MAKQMDSNDSRVLGLMFFLLLVMPPPLVSAGSFWPNALSWRNLNHHLGQEWEGFSQRARYHRSEEESYRFCDGKFDLYFLLDTSDNMKGSWEEMYKPLEEMVKKYTNRQLRMSFISSDGQVLMNPTADRKAIQDGISRIQNIVPSGKINMENGFKKINELIQPVYKRDNKAASLIISMVGGMMPEETLHGTRRETNKARNMGAKVYSVGLQDYSRRQLTHLVDGEYQIYGRNNYNTIDDFVKSLVENSCLDVMGEDTYFVCVGENYNLGFFSPVLKEQNLKDYICRYKLDNSTVYTLKAINMTKLKLICQGHIFEKAQQVVVVDYSLDNGLTFQEKKRLKMTSRKCVNHPTKNQQVSNPTSYQANCPYNTQASNPTTYQTTCPYNPHNYNPTTYQATCPYNPTTCQATCPYKPTTYQATFPDNPQAFNPTTCQATCPYNPTTCQATCPYNPTTYQATFPDNPQAFNPTTCQVTYPDNTQVSQPVQPPALHSSPRPPPPIKTHLYLVVFIPAMFVFPLLFCCIWRLCHKKTVKEPPPVLKPEKEPCPMQICPRVIVPCCGCQVHQMRMIEDKLGFLCDFVQNYNHVPLMCCQCWDKGRCIDVTVVNPHCTPMSYGPMTCLGPSQDYFPLNSCCSWYQHSPQICSQLPSRMYPLNSLRSWCQQHSQICSQLPSRMLPLIPPTARALCRTTLSLPPP